MARKQQHATHHSKKRRRRIMARKQHDTRKSKKRRQRGGKVDIQKKIEKLGIEFHPFSLSKRKRYQYLGPGTFLKKRLARGDPGINRLDRIAKQHDIDYSNAKNIWDKWKADLKMVHAIDALPGKKSPMEKLSQNIIAAKRKFQIVNDPLRRLAIKTTRINLCHYYPLGIYLRKNQRHHGLKKKKQMERNKKKTN